MKKVFQETVKVIDQLIEIDYKDNKTNLKNKVKDKKLEI